MCEFDKKFLEDMEERLNKKIETKAHTMSPATEAALRAMNEKFLDEIKKIREQVDSILPVVQESIERRHAYKLVREDIKNGSGYIKGMAAILIAFGAITGYLQTFIKMFLGLK